MAYCINCGQKLPEGAKYCSNCGNPVIKNNNSTERKTVYEGELHKCPNCGERLDSFVAVCPTCGYELRGAKATSVVNELARKLEKVQSTTQRNDLIRNFYIPNTKEDIYEFFILATSNLNVDSHENEAWYTKLEQAYQKAWLSFGNELEFEHLDQLYKKAKKQQKSHSIFKNLKKHKFLQSLLLGAVGIIMIIIGSFGGSLSGDPDSPFYMISMIGIFPILGAFMIMISNKKE